MGRSLCQHCRRSPATRPRGLCGRCYFTPGVRELFPSTSKFGRREYGNFYHDVPPLPTATDAAPGSEAKLAVLIERCRIHVGLWHEADPVLVARQAPGPKVRRWLGES